LKKSAKTFHVAIFRSPQKDDDPVVHHIKDKNLIKSGEIIWINSKKDQVDSGAVFSHFNCCR